MIGFCPLASGSKGNCIYVGSKNTKVLIDAGISFKKTASLLSEIQVDISEIEAILITHEHGDHISGLSAFANRLNIPIFANSETAKAINQSYKFKIFSTGETFVFGDLEIHPFSIQHDTMDPVAFTIVMEGKKLGFCTDLGFASTLVKAELQNCHYLYLEANHEPSMVHASSRPMVYKQRVLSRQGHLSNHDSSELLLDIFHEDLKHVHLAHLSSECNNPELALKIFAEKLKGKKVEFSIAYQDKLSKAIRL